MRPLTCTLLLLLSAKAAAQVEIPEADAGRRDQGSQARAHLTLQRRGAAQRLQGLTGLIPFEESLAQHNLDARISGALGPHRAQESHRVKAGAWAHL